MFIAKRSILANIYGNVVIPELSKIEIFGNDPNRKVKCCYCNDIATRSILPHLRAEHPKEWNKWKKEILKSYNKGMNPKKIMTEIFSINSKPLFTWSVIEKEIAIMIEEGINVKLPIKEKIQFWKPNDRELFNELDKTTTWKFRKRGDWATHTGNYRGNWPPQIPRYFIKKYTKPHDLIFDGFLGSGTTVIEARLLGRNAIGYDINPYAIKLTKKQLEIIEKESKKQNHLLPSCNIKVEVNDVKDLRQIADESIDLICTHPPYFNSLKYTQSIENDLSRISNVNIFLDQMTIVTKGFYRILKPNKICAILIGDIRIKKNMYPLASNVMNRFLDEGFILKDTIIKEQYNDRSTAFYVNHDIRRINHEYLFIFEKRI
jgi:DNA modification methylase